MTEVRYVFILSDATGDTASRVVRAAMKQFMGKQLVVKRFTNVLRKSEVRGILKEALKAPTFVAHTFAATPLRKIVEAEADELGIETIDLLGPLLTSMQAFLEEKPLQKPGLFHQIDEHYFRRIDAVEFAVMHDDGKHLEGLKHADFVLVGLSRSGKTPLSVYLSLEGYRVGNVPLVHGQKPPKELLDLPRDKVVGLLIDPRRLTEIRRSRLEYIAPGRRMTYDDEAQVREEIVWVRRTYGKLGLRAVDVTQKAIEESAHEVLTLVGADPRPRSPSRRRLRKRA